MKNGLRIALNDQLVDLATADVFTLEEEVKEMKQGR